MVDVPGIIDSCVATVFVLWPNVDGESIERIRQLCRAMVIERLRTSVFIMDVEY